MYIYDLCHGSLKQKIVQNKSTILSNITMICHVVLILFACINLAIAENITSIFILAGQSNMFGQGGVHNRIWDGYVPPECQPSPLIFRLNYSLVWEEAREPLHGYRQTPCGIGPGMSFAHSLLERDSSIGMIGLVPCAIAGSNISQWSRGSEYYNEMLSRVNTSLLCSGGEIRTMLWYQGESDSFDEEAAKAYKGRLKSFFTAVRSDLQLPVLPIIQVALASGGDYIDIVRKTQLEFDFSNVTTVDAMGLELEPDHLHLTTAAQVHLGQMLAGAFINSFNVLG